MDEIKKHAVTERKTENERKREGPRRRRDEGDKGGGQKGEGGRSF